MNKKLSRMINNIKEKISLEIIEDSIGIKFIKIFQRGKQLMDKTGEWKEFLFYITACVFYLGISILLLAWPGQSMLKIVLAIGAIINHVVLAGFIFTHDMDEKKLDNIKTEIHGYHDVDKFYPDDKKE